MTRQKPRYYALKLCLALSVIYGVQVLTGFDPGFNASTSPLWKFFTSIFGHSGLEHLLNNLFFIGVFGTILELYTDSKTFVYTFLGAGLFANISAFIFFPTHTIIGASGAGVGVLAALTLFKPRKIGLALGIPAPMWAVMGIYLLINVAGIYVANGVAYEAHLLGMMAGAAIGYRLRGREETDFDLGKTTPSQQIDDDWKRTIRSWEEKWMMN